MREPAIPRLAERAASLPPRGRSTAQRAAAALAALVSAALLSPSPAEARNASADTLTSRRAYLSIDTDGARAGDGTYARDAIFFPVGYYGEPGPETGANCALLGTWHSMSQLRPLAASGLKLIVSPFMSEQIHSPRPLGIYKYYSYDCATRSYAADTAAFRTFFEDTVLVGINTLDDPWAVVGWYLADEPDLQRWACPDTTIYWRPEDLALFRDVIKSTPGNGLRDLYGAIANDQDKNHPNALENLTGIRRFADCVDVVMNDEYQFRNCCGFDTYWFAGYNAREAGRYPESRDKPFIAISQAFGPCARFCDGSTGPPSNWWNVLCTSGCRPQYHRGVTRTHDGLEHGFYWPRYEDLRHVTYSALIEGARGFLHFQAGHACCSESPDTSLYAMTNALRSELTRGDARGGVPPLAEVMLGWDTTDSEKWTCTLDGEDRCAADSGWGGDFRLSGRLNYYAARKPDSAPFDTWILIAVNDCADAIDGSSEAGFAYDAAAERTGQIRSIRLATSPYGAYSQDTAIRSVRNCPAGFADRFAPWEVRVYVIELSGEPCE